MKKFYNSKSRVIFMLVFALLLQIVGPVVVDAIGVVEEGETQTEGEEDENLGADVETEPLEEGSKEILEESKDLEEGEAVESEPGEEIETDKVENENLLSPRPELLNTPKDLGNIFTLKSFRVNGVEADGNQVVDITDGTTVNLDYTWDTKGKDAKTGDWAEIDVPDAFKLDRTFENEPILVGGVNVGTYSLIDNKIRFEFNENIEEGTVQNGFLGFGVKFNEEKFQEDIVEEIEFKDSGDKTITIIGKPSVSISSINKSGNADSDKDAKEITWTIDILNPSDKAIEDAKIKDILPDGLELKEASLKVNNLNIKLNGDLSEGSEITVGSPTITGQEIELNLPTINPYKGYRIKYTTTITDKSITQFTNNASFKHGDKELPAEATVSIERSADIEKDGKKLDDKTIGWTIDVNKSGGSIGNAIIEDTLPTGVTLVPGSMEIVKLTQDGDNWNESPSNKTATGFPVTLEEIDEAYRIKFKTDIDYSEFNSGKYQKDNSFINKTILKDGEKEIGNADKTVKITRDPILSKDGKQYVDYEKKEIKWTVTVNKANHKIDGAIVKDTLPAGLTISEEAIEVFTGDRKDGEGGTKVIEGVTITVPPNDGTTETEVTITLGDIEEEYTIEYTTKITNFNIDKFLNKVSLEGTGVGTGGTIKPVPVEPAKNSYSKSYKGIDYNEKNISWETVANPTREAFKTLKITDTFPNDGLILLNDEDNPLIVKIGETKLDEGIDYTLEEKDGNYNNGFVVEFQESVLPINAKVVMTYTTSYDPEKGIKENTGKGLYKNQAVFEGKTINDNSIDVTRNDKKQVNKETVNTGKKVGRLISIDPDGNKVNRWISGNERKIEWEVYTNYLEQDLKTGVSITDELGYDGEIDIDGIKVRKYDVSKEGETTLGVELDSSKYTKIVDGKNLTINFKEAVSERYVVIFTTSVPEISQKTYTNTAKLEAGGKEYPYTGSIGFNKADKNISKKTLNTDGDKVYTDDKVDWEVKINEALSVVEKDVKIVDTISKGMEYENDSLKIYKLVGGEEVLVDPTSEEGYTLDVKRYDEDENTVLTINFKGSINSTYIIKYSTVITAIDGKVNNKVDYSGKNLETKSIITDKLSASQFSYIGGEWDPKKGKIIINKVDNENERITAEAEFEVYYILNGEEQLVGGQTYKTKDGKIEIGNLLLNRTYYIREKTAPNGFEFDRKADPIEVKVTKPANKVVYNENIKNDNIKIGITGKKVWEGGPGADIELQLYRNDKALEGEEYKVKLESGTTSYTWEDLNKTDNSGEDYIYTVKEVGVPDGYTKTEEGLTVTNKVKKGDIEFKKINTSGNPLKGAEFKIYKASDVKFENPLKNPTTEEDIIVVSDEGGIVRFEDLDYNNYIIRETKAPSGYYRTSQLIEVSFEDFLEAEEVVEVVVVEKDDLKNNRIVYGRDSLELVKLGEDGKTDYLSGAIFELLQNGEVKYTSGVTGSDGRVTFTNLAYGTYTVREKQAPEGYVLDPQAQEISITTGEELKTLTFTNKKARGNIRLIKTDDARSPNLLAGAEFTLYDSEGKVLEKTVSNKDGEVLFKNLVYGEYTIRETKAPEGYELNDKEFKVSISEDGVTVDKDIDGLDLRLENKIIPDEDVVDPDDPGGGGRPTDPEDPEGGEIDPTKPGEGGRPTDPTKPGEPSKPTDPVKPAKPGKPGQSGLPKTGQVSNGIFYLLGAVFIGLGFRMRKKK